MKIAWVGDSNNVLNSLIAASIKFNFQLNIGCPKKYSPSKPVLEWVKSFKNKIFTYIECSLFLHLEY